MTIRRINFHSIPVDDQDRAVDFYTGKLGFERHTDAPWAPRVRWATIKDSEGNIVLLESLKEG